MTHPRPTYRILARAGAVKVTAEPAPSRDPAQESRVNEIWQTAGDAASLHDGMVCLYLDHHMKGDTLLVRAQICCYRYFWAQRRGVNLDPPIRPLAVSGALLAAGREENLLLAGQRSGQVEQYKNAWELIPSGGLGEECREDSGQIDYTRQLLRELSEEAGLGPETVSAVRPLGLVEDSADGVVDICCALESGLLADDLRGSLSGSGEYQRMDFFTSREIRSLAGNAEGLVATSLAILELLEMN